MYSVVYILDFKIWFVNNYCQLFSHFIKLFSTFFSAHKAHIQKGLHVGIYFATQFESGWAQAQYGGDKVKARLVFAHIRAILDHITILPKIYLHHARLLWHCAHQKPDNRAQIFIVQRVKTIVARKVGNLVPSLDRKSVV